jgi:hypothetical protein
MMLSEELSLDRLATIVPLYTLCLRYLYTL